MTLSRALTLNAFTGDDTGETVSGRLDERADRWGGLGSPLRHVAPLAPDAAVDPSDWTHPDIGWGVVLADRDDLSPEEKARGDDAPNAIRDLIAARGGAPVLRYRPDLGVQKLARYFPDGGRQDPEVGLTPFGTGKGRLPLYLLIVGSPEVLPWRLQYSLNRRHHVGRLDLPDEGLTVYVRHLIDGWAAATTDPTSPVVWSVGFDSMLTKMEATIAAQVRNALSDDGEIGDRVLVLTKETATHPALADALHDAHPSLVVTTSHGKTGPLEDPDALAGSLGLPVDADRETMDPDDLLAKWSPGGAIWYAHACCSAGCDGGTVFDGLLAEESLAARVVHAVGEIGPRISPLPTRLLAADPPLRAFIGHVEPTFDWTLIADDTGQFLTAPLVAAIYPNIYRRWPVGRAFESHYRGVGLLYAKLQDARDGIDKLIAGARARATYYRLTASDRESLVILGDPTVVMPPLPSQSDAGNGTSYSPDH
jgi:hypothetical protein